MTGGTARPLGGGTANGDGEHAPPAEHASDRAARLTVNICTIWAALVVSGGVSVAVIMGLIKLSSVWFVHGVR